MAENDKRRTRTDRAERPRSSSGSDRSERPRSGSGSDRSERPRSGYTSTSTGRSSARSSSPEGLLELAEQIEEHGRALLARARDLRRMAESGEGSPRRTTGTRTGGSGGSRTGEGGRPPRRTSERASGGERSRPSRSGGTGERSRNRTERDDTPDWAPTPKRRRT